jgi:hypothetical protein
MSCVIQSIEISHVLLQNEDEAFGVVEDEDLGVVEVVEVVEEELDIVVEMEENDSWDFKRIV